MENKLAQLLRLWVKKTPWIYKPVKKWQYANIQYEKYFCTPESDLCLEGYPSSANSFFNALLYVVNPRINVGHHTHSIANIKLAFRYEIPVFVLVRSPEDAIASRVTRFDQPLEFCIDEYIDFYSFVLERRNEINVLGFNEVVDNTRQALRKVEATTGVDLTTKNLQECKDDVFTYLEVWSKEHDDASRVSLPRSKRDEKKQKVKSEFRSKDSGKRAIELYREITGTSG